MTDTNKDTKSGEETVTLTKQEMADVRAILKSNGEKDAKIKELSDKVDELSSRKPAEERVVDPTIKVGSKGTLKKTPDGLWIVGYTKRPNGRAVYKEVNPSNQNETLEFIDLLVIGKDKPVKTRYKDFIEDYQSEEVEFVRKEKKPAEIIKDGFREQAVFDPKAGEMVATGRKVPATVVNDTRESVVVILDGKEVQIDDNFINQ